MKYSCKFPNCSNKYFAPVTDPNYRNKSFFRFPTKNVSACRQWTAICNINDNTKCNNFYVCQDHFLPSEYIKPNKIKLNFGAIPKCYIIQNDHDYCLSGSSNEILKFVPSFNLNISKNNNNDCQPSTSKEVPNLVLSNVSNLQNDNDYCLPGTSNEILNPVHTSNVDLSQSISNLDLI